MIPPILILALTVLLAFVLMLATNLSPDVIALCVAVVLGLTGVLTPNETIAGFSNPAVITILGAFIMTHALTVTGITRKIGRFLTRATSQGGDNRLSLLVMILSAGLSLVMNKIVAAAVLLPPTIDVSIRNRVPLSRVMIPLAFATSFGGMATLLNTGNLVVSSTLSERGYQGYGLLDFIPVGVPIAVLGILILWYEMRRWRNNPGSPETQASLPLSKKLADWYELRGKVNLVHISPGAPLVNKTLSQSQLGEQFGMSVMAVLRRNRSVFAPSASELVLARDTLVIVGSEEKVQRLANLGVEIEPCKELDPDIVNEDMVLFEVIPSIRSLAVGQTLKSLHFRERFNASVIASWHGGYATHADHANKPIQYGDSMLVYGPTSAVNLLQHADDFIVLRAPAKTGLPVRSNRAILALVIIVCTLLITALNILPTASAMLIGALAMVLSGCLKMEEAYRAVDWRAIFLIAGMSSISLAMLKTGAADLIGNSLVTWLAAYGPLAVAASLLLTTMLISQIVSGQVAAFFFAPIAISAAQTVGVDPRAMAMYVAFGASLTFLTPAAHSANLLVMSVGGYSSRDYLRVGLPLTILLVIGILAIVPLVLKF